MKPTYAAVVGKIPLRRTRSEEFPPLVRDPLPLSQGTQPTEGQLLAVGTVAAVTASSAVPAVSQDSPPPADPTRPLPPLMPQDDPDAILVDDDEEDEFAEGSEMGEEQPSTSSAVASSQQPRVVVTHVTTESGQSIPVKATEEAAWGSTTLSEHQEQQYWKYVQRFTEFGWDPNHRKVPRWIRDRYLATVKEQQTAEEELRPPADPPLDAPYYAGPRPQGTGRGGFAAYPDPPPSPTPLARVVVPGAPSPGG